MEEEKYQLGDVVWWHFSQQQWKAVPRYSSCQMTSVMNSHKSLLSVLLLLQDSKQSQRQKPTQLWEENSMVCCSHNPFRDRNVNFHCDSEKRTWEQRKLCWKFFVVFFQQCFWSRIAPRHHFALVRQTLNPILLSCYRGRNATKIPLLRMYFQAQKGWFSLSILTTHFKQDEVFLYKPAVIVSLTEFWIHAKNARLKIQQSLRKNTFLSKPDLAESEAVPAVTTRQAGLLHRGRVGRVEVPSLLIIQSYCCN